ncbi:MAG: TonB-dependent receptor, partial [Bacteroidales bacterium]|nr:TonB-dependent receptor [Bacteroidales bacterium]
SFDDLRMGRHNHDEYQRLQYVETNNGNDTILENDNPNSQLFSGYNQYNLMQKVRFRPNDKIDVEYGFHYSNTSDIPRYDRLTQYSDTTLKYATWYYGPQRWMLNALNVKISDTNSFFDKVKLTAAYQNYEESRHDRKLHKYSINERFENVNVYSLNLDFDKSLKTTSHFFYGIEFFFNTNKSTAHEKDIFTGSLSTLETRYPDGINRQLIVAPYVSYKNNISEKVTLLTGIRYNYIQLYSTFVDTSFHHCSPDPLDNTNSAFNGSLGFVFRPTESWQINLNLSSGFHAPNLDGLAKVFQPSSGNVLVPNSSLIPEYSYNMDAGIIKNFNSIASIEATLFYSRVVDPFVTQDYLYNGESWIVFDGDTNNVIAIVNAGHADIFGGNITFKADLTDFLSFRSHLSVMQGFYDNDEPLRHVSPLFGSTYLTYNTAKTRLEIYAIYNGEISHENLAFAERDKPYMYATDNNGNLYSPGWWT